MKKILTGFMTCLFMAIGILSPPLIGRAEAKSSSECYEGVTVHVSDACGFYNAVANASADTIIELDNDIYLDSPMNVGFIGSIHKNGHKVTETYTINYPGYYTVEPVISHVPNPPVAVYDNYGRVAYYRSVPDTDIITYQNVWHPERTEFVCREIF